MHFSLYKRVLGSSSISTADEARFTEENAYFLRIEIDKMEVGEYDYTKCMCPFGAGQCVRKDLQERR